MKENIEMTKEKLDGVTFYWTHKNINRKFEDPIKGGEWSCEAGNLTKEHIKTLKDLNLAKRIKDEDDERGKFIKIKRSEFRSVKDEESGEMVRGEANEAPRFVDASRKPIDSLIGNGSKGNVLFRAYEYNNRFGKGYSTDLLGVQVTELVKFGSDEDGASLDFDDLGETVVIESEDEDEVDLDLSDDDFED